LNLKLKAQIMEPKNFWEKNKVTIIGAGVVILLLFIYMGMSISYNNHANQLEVASTQKIKANKVDYDAMWKTVSEQMGVTDKYKDAFKEIYIEMMEGRYSHDNGKLMMWIQERNPNFDASMYKTIMNTIESKRTDFATRQKELIAIEEEYNRMLVTFPGSWFVGDRKPMDNTVITSTKTERVFETGLDDEPMIK
jgi:hypothetical protein